MYPVINVTSLYACLVWLKESKISEFLDKIKKMFQWKK